jgi:hypothetical protein
MLASVKTLGYFQFGGDIVKRLLALSGAALTHARDPLS